MKEVQDVCISSSSSFSSSCHLLFYFLSCLYLVSFGSPVLRYRRPTRPSRGLKTCGRRCNRLNNKTVTRKHTHAHTSATLTFHVASITLLVSRFIFLPPPGIRKCVRWRHSPFHSGSGQANGVVAAALRHHCLLPAVVRNTLSPCSHHLYHLHVLYSPSS